MNLSKDYIDNVYATYGQAGQDWLAQLPSQLDFLSKKMGFRFIKPVSDLSYNFVALVELHETGEVVILKTAPKAGNIIAEARWLQHFHRGAARVLEIEEEQNAFLMERLVPGETLKSLVKAGQDENATRILCQTILELHAGDLHVSRSSASAASSASSAFSVSSALPASMQTPYHPISSKHVSENIQYLAFLKGHVEDGMFSKVQSLFRDLSSDRKEDVLLHGDLHHDNILKSGSTWKVIDPHCVLGDPAAECGPMMYNPLDCFPDTHALKHVIDSRLKILCEMLPFDPERIKAWAFCWTLLSGAWDVEGFGKVLKNKIEIAEAIDKHLFE